MAVDELAGLLRRGAEVHVHHLDEGGRSARVTHALDCEDHDVVLQLDVDDGVEAIPVGARVEVTCPDEGRAHVCTATVIASDERTIRLAGGTDLRPVQRRRERRVPVRFAVHCRRLGRGGFDEVVQTVDLSTGGAGIVAGAALVVGDVVMLTVEAGNGDEVSCKGLVVATSPSPRYRRQRHAHIAFSTLSDTTRERLTRIIDLHDHSGADT
jgi:c-di-GMP-binding flagellar brake protein YcgR